MILMGGAADEAVCTVVVASKTIRQEQR